MCQGLHDRIQTAGSMYVYLILILIEYLDLDPSTNTPHSVEKAGTRVVVALYIEVTPPQRLLRINVSWARFFPLTFHNNNSTMESRIMAALDDLKPQDDVNYTATARKWEISSTTLARRHQGKSTTRVNVNSKYH
jgi:hypothetical protein